VALGALVLAAVYVLGGLTPAHGLGRLIAWAALFVQLGAAAALADLEERLSGRARFAVPAVAVACALWLTNGQPDAVRRLRHPSVRRWPALTDILAPVGEDDTVVASEATSWMVPAFAGKVVASIHPLYWVPDHDERRAALAAFFRVDTSDDERRGLLARFDARWLVLDDARLAESERTRLLALGREARRVEPFTLVAVGPSRP
jgi:hypothetical protein